MFLQINTKTTQLFKHGVWRNELFLFMKTLKIVWCKFMDTILIQITWWTRAVVVTSQQRSRDLHFRFALAQELFVLFARLLPLLFQLFLEEGALVNEPHAAFPKRVRTRWRRCKPTSCWKKSRMNAGSRDCEREKGVRTFPCFSFACELPLASLPLRSAAELTILARDVHYVYITTCK